MHATSPAVILDLARAVFPRASALVVERVPEGVSTEVYRLRHDDAVSYLRVLPEEGASFAPEVFVHNLLGAHGLHVPAVVHFEPFNPALCRSVMVTTAIPGGPIGYGARPAEVRHLLQDAGRELAVVNGVDVTGFGWVSRAASHVTYLQAECSTWEEWMHRDYDEPVALLRQQQVVSPQQFREIDRIIQEASTLFCDAPAMLAHGDFDVTHIYHQHGRYAGMIDFGEIRGAHRWYDLGHFAVENPDLLPYLLEGYADVVPLSPDHMRCIRMTSLLIAVRRSGRCIAKHAALYQPDVGAIQRVLPELMSA